MKKIVVTAMFCLVISSMGFSQDKELEELKSKFSDLEFKYDNVTGIGHEAGITRLDASDIIKVGDTYYVYYTKIYGLVPGYWGTLWYASSTDEGFSWEEQGEILGLGKKGAFDSQATFTPNILSANGKYYLYYTGVKPTPGNKAGEFENNSTTDITAIGVAISDSPDGPFTRVSEDPILKVSVEPEKFDSYRVDDAVLMYRNGLYWLYYKGRSRISGPGRTEMGVAFSQQAEGPFEKYHKTLLSNSHAVTLWQEGHGIACLASLSKTFEYSADGIDFHSNRLHVKVENSPKAPGVFRQDLTDQKVRGEGIKWGLSLVKNGNEAYLVRYSVNY